jgi:hypothetical protein
MSAAAEGPGRKLLAALAAFSVLSLAPLLLLTGKVSTMPLPDCHVGGDPALIELATRRAMAGSQLTGPCSGLDLCQPGPALLYLLAPLYSLSGDKHLSFWVTVTALNTACLFAVFWLGRRLRSWWAAAWIALVLSLYALYLGPDVLSSPWHPYVTILPLAFSVVALAGVVSGSVLLLPVAAAAATLCVQSNLGCTPAVAATWMTALGLCLLRYRRSRPGARVAVALLVTGAALTLLWLPPLLEGHLSGIMSAPGDGEGAGISAAVPLVARQASAFLLSPLGASADETLGPVQTVVAQVLTAVQVILLVAGIRYSRGRARSPGSALCALGLALLVAATISAATDTGGVPELMTWISACGPLNAVAIAIALVPVTAGRSRTSARTGAWIMLAALIASTGAGFNSTLHSSDDRSIRRRLNDRDQRGYQHLSHAALRALDQVDGNTVKLRNAGAGTYSSLAALWLALDKAEYTTLVDCRCCSSAVQDRWRPSGMVDLAVCRGAPCEEIAASPLARLVAESNGVQLYLSRLEPWPRNGLLPALPLFDTYIINGFQPCHPRMQGKGRWSRGSASRLVLPLAPGQGYRLEITAHPARMPGRTQELCADLNGEPLGCVEMSQKLETYTFEIPAATVAGHNLLQLRYAYTVIPSKIRDSQDNRLLAVRFRRIAAVPADQAGA